MKKIYERLRSAGYDVYFENDSIIIPEKEMIVYYDKSRSFFCIEFIYERQKFQQNIEDYNVLYDFLTAFLSGKVILKRLDEYNISINNWEICTKRNKIFKTVHRILNILFGAGLTLCSLLFLITGLIYYIDYTSFNWLADTTPVPTAIAGIVIGLSMIHHGKAKEPLPLCGTVLYGVGVILSSFGMSLLFWLSSEYNETPKVDFIGTSLVFIMFIVMGIFMLISGLRCEKTEMPVNFHFLTRIPELPSDEDIKRLIDKIKQKSRKETILIKINPDKDISVFDSKLGGLPYWDLSRSYPVDSYGAKMLMLAQFNLSQLPENDVFPEKGILQFFNSVYFDGDECRVIYHESIDNSLTENDIKSLDIPDSSSEENSAFTGKCGMDFTKTTVSVNPDDSTSDILMHDTAKELGISIDKTLRFYEICADDEEYEELYSCENFLLGYPFFINYDVRPDENKYNTLLFQIGSAENSKLNMIWGDWGTAYFFINDKELADMNFNDIFFSWDCS